MSDQPKYEPRYIDANASPQEKVVAIRAVIKELQKYQGELVAANEHPLHRAVVALEALCRIPNPKRLSAENPLAARMWPGATKYWYPLLWASRGLLRKEHDPSRTYQENRIILTAPDSKYAKLMRDELLKEMNIELIRLKQ